MACNDIEPRLVPALLERLLDDDPGNSRERVGDRFYDVRRMKAAVAHDLEELPNTRREALDDLPQ
jgi:predicted component of type VI protein secretion system